jgi:hypothetical protein
MYMAELMVTRDTAHNWCNPLYAALKFGTMTTSNLVRKQGHSEFLVIRSKVTKEEREQNRNLAEQLNWTEEQLNNVNNPLSENKSSNMSQLDLHQYASVLFAKDKETLVRALRHHGSTVVSAKGGGAIGVYKSSYRTTLGGAWAMVPAKGVLGTAFANLSMLVKGKAPVVTVKETTHMYARGMLRRRGYYVLLALAQDLARDTGIGDRSAYMTAQGYSTMGEIATLLS